MAPRYLMTSNCLELILRRKLGEQQRVYLYTSSMSFFYGFMTGLGKQMQVKQLSRESFCLCRIRFERGRSRTRERALLAMEGLINSCSASFPGMQTRSRYIHLVAYVSYPLKGVVSKIAIGLGFLPCRIWLQNALVGVLNLNELLKIYSHPSRV